MNLQTIINTYSNQRKIAIYIRNTTLEQQEEHRLYHNHRLLRDKYDWEGCEISNLYIEESTSSDMKECLVLQQLLEDAEKGLFDVVLSWDCISLTSDIEEIQLIERELDRYGVDLCFATEEFDTSTEEGRAVIEYMCKLLNTKHLVLSAMRDIPLSQVARWFIEDEAKEEGEYDAKSSRGTARPA